MFCSNCGENLSEGVAFCAKCGAKVGGGTVPAQEAPKPSAKDNVEGGIPLSASPAVLHKKLVSSLCEAPSLPLDLFDKVEVIREEHYCVPAYCFHCNGTESFNYEVSNERSQVVVRNTGEKSWEETRKHKEWTPSNGTASVMQTIFASGNRKMAPQIEKLYTYFDSKKLVSAEELAFPGDIVTLNSDLLQSTAFNEFAVPRIEKELKRKAEEVISKQITTGLTMGGANIQKEAARVLLGLYRIVLKYGDKEYSVWMTGDGQRAYHEGLPEDTQRSIDIDNKKEAMEEELAAIADSPVAQNGLKPSVKRNVIPIVSSVVIVIVLINLLSYFFRIGTLGRPLQLLILIGGIGASILWVIIRSKKKKTEKEENEAKRAQIKARYQSEIDQIVARSKIVARQFMSQKKALRGIYEGVSGDASAF